MASYLSLLSLLKEQAAYPWKAMPVMLMALAAASVKDLHDQAKIERCAKVAGEVVYVVTTALNEFLDGKWNQQGHRECLMCHADHTA